MPSKPIHVVAKGKVLSFFWLSSIPLYIYNIFFIHLSVDGYLGRFHILATVNNAAMNIGVHVFFQINVFIFFHIYSGMELLGHMVVLFFIF